MKLEHDEIQAGLAAVANFLHPEYKKYSNQEKYFAKKQAQDWLAPCLIRLPDIRLSENSLADLLGQEVFLDEFYDAAIYFELNSARSKQENREYPDGELIRRIPEEKIETSARNLRRLCEIFMQAVESMDDEDFEFPVMSIEETLASFDSFDFEEEFRKNF